MSTTPASADAYAHAHELHQRISTARAAAADAVDQLRQADAALPTLTRRTLDRLLTSINRNLADAERVAHPVNIGHARLVDAIAPTTDDQGELFTTEARA